MRATSARLLPESDEAVVLLKTNSALVDISGIPLAAFPLDRQKEVRIILREITARIRRLREML